jgi:hypothetical protein
MLIPVGFAQANWKFTGNCVPNGAEITMGLDITGTALTTPEIAEACFLSYSGNMMDQHATAITLVSCLVKEGPNNTGASAEFTGATAGTVTGDTELPQGAVLVRKNTALGGHAGSGRNYLPGFNENLFSSNGQAAGPDVAGIQGAWDDFIASLLVSELVPVLLHSEGSPITTPTPITSFSVQALAATQRRRLRG